MENFTTMEARGGGGSFFNLDTDDEFLFLDPNLPPLDSIAPDFSFLDSTAPNGSLLPADEWSGTTNALPDTPSSHQHLQHGLEGSSPLQSQLQCSQPVIPATKQPQPQPQPPPQPQPQPQTQPQPQPQSQPPQPQQQQQQQQQFVFESHAPTSQTTLEVPGGGQQQQQQHPQQQQPQHGIANEQVDGLTTQGVMPTQQLQQRPTLQPAATSMQIDRATSFTNNRPVMLNVSTAQQGLPPAQAAVGAIQREIALQNSNFQGLGPDAAAALDANFGGQNQRNLENRQLPGSMPGFQGPMERMALSRGLMMNGHLSLPGANTQQMGMQGQQPGLNHMQTSDGDGPGVSLQAQLINNQANFPGHANVLQASQYMAKANPRQSMLPGHGLSNIPSFQLQASPHQLQLQGQAKLHPQVLSSPTINPGLLQTRQVHQPSVFPSAQQQSYQLLQQQGFQMHHSPGNHLAFGRQMFPQVQPRLQSPILQGLRFGSLGARQFGQQVVGPQVATGPPEAARYPPSGANAAKCAQIFMLYVQEQRKRPADNNINFWREFVRKYFAPGATKRWCLTSYSTTPVGRHAQGLFPMDYWYCNLCGVQPGRGFESGTDVLPRLFKIKYDSGLQDELLFLDVASEKYSLPSGKIVLEYSRAVHESVFNELRVIRHGKLRVTFNSAFKICSWEFCTKAHEEVVPRKNLLQQVHQLASLVIETDQENFDKSADNLKNQCNAFTKAAKQLAVQLDAPMVNDLGFSKRYVRCLQIAEVVNSMKDLISFERKTGLGPVESLSRFPTVKKLQMEGGLPPSLTLTQVINELTQGPSSLQSSTVTRVNSEAMSEAPENQAQSSTFKAMEHQRNSIDSRLHHLFQSAEAFNQIQPQQPQPGQVPAHSMSQISQLTTQAQPQALSQPVATQALPNQQQAISNNQMSQQATSYQQVVLKSAAAKSSLSQPQSVNQTSLPGTPQSEMSDMRTNT